MTVLAALLSWYRRHARDLPWRKTRDSYDIFISELMLQQTQVDRVIPKYREWIKRLPNWKKLAAASTRELVNLWAGLGYNRRALYARDAAREVVAHGVPKSEADWRRLKGVGPYMAAVLAEFVNRQRAIVIDTNVRRVAGRAFLGLPYPHLSDDARIRKAIDRALPERGPHWLVPHAMMDLGSAICLPKIPRCDVCPLKTACRAKRRFDAVRLDATLALLKRHRERTRVIESRHAEKKHPDRIYRGRILAWIRSHGSTKLMALGARIDETYDPVADLDWVRRMAKRLVKDRLIVLGAGDTISLPHS